MEPSGDFVNAVAALALRAATAENKRPTFESYKGVPYAVTQAGITDLRKVRPAAPTLHLSTLTGLVDYLASELDGDPGHSFALHVESPTKVSVVAPVDHPDPEIDGASFRRR